MIIRRAQVQFALLKASISFQRNDIVFLDHDDVLGYFAPGSAAGLDITNKMLKSVEANDELTCLCKREASTSERRGQVTRRTGKSKPSSATDVAINTLIFLSLNSSTGSLLELPPVCFNTPSIFLVTPIKYPHRTIPSSSLTPSRIIARQDAVWRCSTKMMV